MAPKKKKVKITPYEFPAGTYYIGDLGHVMGSRWEVMQYTECFLQHCRIAPKVWQLGDGTTYFSHMTYTEGTHSDAENHAYPVVSGAIGCVHEQWVDTKEGDVSKGRMVTFDKPFICVGNERTVKFGDKVKVMIECCEYCEDARCSGKSCEACEQCIDLDGKGCACKTV